MLKFIKYWIFCSLLIACGFAETDKSLKEKLETIRSQLTFIKAPETLNSNYDKKTIINILKTVLKIRQTLREYIENIPNKKEIMANQKKDVYQKLDDNTSMGSNKEMLYAQKLDNISQMKAAVKEEEQFLSDEIINTNQEFFDGIALTFLIIDNTDKDIITSASLNAFNENIKKFKQLQRQMLYGYSGYRDITFFTEGYRIEKKYQDLFSKLLVEVQKILNTLKNSQKIKSDKQKYEDVIHELNNMKIELDKDLKF